MKKQITFYIKCGEKTCATREGNFCRFFINTGSRDGKCNLFGRVFDKDGWIQRHKNCIHITEENK